MNAIFAAILSAFVMACLSSVKNSLPGEHSESLTSATEAQLAAAMSGAGRAHRQDPSFLNSANGPSISAQGVASRGKDMASANAAPASPRGGAANGASMGNNYTEYNDGTTTDVLGDRSPAAMGRSYGPMPGADRPEVSFHVNPDFDNEAHTNSDVLLQGYEAHNRIPNWPHPQQAQQYASHGDEDGPPHQFSPSHAQRSPTSSRYPAPYEPPSPGNSVRTVGMSNVLDRHYPQRTGSRRGYQPSEIHQTGGGVSGSIAATAELSVLIERAKHLLSHHDPNRNTSELQRLLGSSAYMQAKSEHNHSSTLPPIEDEGEEVPDEELLQMHLDAKDNLKSAYAMLNDQYSAPTNKSLTIDALTELDSNGLKRSSDNSDNKSDDNEIYKMKQGPGEEFEDPVGAAAVPLLTHSDYLRERETERRAKRMVRVKLFPMLLYISFILAWLLYAYVRVRHGMGGLTLPLIIYSYVVLVVEMLGGLNMIFYGCWLFAKPVNTDVFPPPDRETGKEAPFRRAYNVRVMIPCYKESLAIIQRTVLASKRADRPPGMKLVIYVCDDGNDEKKLAWVQRMNDPEVKYVTGRDKSQKMLNGKSANLNFCLTKLYPDVVDPENPDELMKIPVNELMCLFDADQTCSKGFFVTMLRYIDSGDDVGVALSPQLMYNVIPDCDVFNHQNVHFWEMMQPGMDALGFISLTGTNMILRARALHQAGWFPMNSVTEDWALGMRFKKLGYRCRYVNQYLAIGEAPDVTQQAFQQRSRWSKGHFQVFWSTECPLFDQRLNLFFRLAYSSTCVSYLSTGLSVIVLNIVPVLTILVGWFPITLNFYTVVGITAYFGALNALSYYCLSWSHYKALWLANNSSVILFWPYLKASIFTPIKSMMGRAMEFKTTLKGAAAHNASLKVLGPSILIVIINVVTFILGIVNFRVAVNAAQGISLCWLVFNTIPHINLLSYSAFGPGGFMVAWCKLGMLLTFASSALAIILMWLLYPRDVDFQEPLNFSVRFMQAQVSGELPADFPIDFRMDSGLQYRTATVNGEDGVNSQYRPQYSLPAFNVTTDLSGGFYEDGPWGPVKLTKTNALTTANLAWAVLDLPAPYEREPQLMADALAMVEHGLKYLLNCYIKDPTDYGNAEGDIYVYQVGDIVKERRRWFRPEDVTTQEEVYFTGGVAAPVDLTGQMTAGIVSATMLLHKHGRLANEDVSANMVIARELFNVTMTIKGVLEHNRLFWTSDSFYDDRLWAVCFPSTSSYIWKSSWMYRAATAQYLPQELASRYYTDMVDSMRDAQIEENTHIVDQDYVLNMGIVHAAVNTYNWEFHAPAQAFIWDWICSGKVDYTNFGRAFAEEAPLLGDTVMAASLAQLYSIRMKGWKLFHPKFERGFQCFAQQQARYLVGTGWQRKSFIQGVNQNKGYDRLLHRSASCPTYPEKCSQNTGGADTKDVNVPDGGLLWNPSFSDKPRNTRGGNSTAVSLGNNAAMPILFAGLQEKTNSWMECLLSDGALLPHPVCDESRPLPATDDSQLQRRQFWGRIFDTTSEDAALAAGSNGEYDLTRNLGPVPRFTLNTNNFEKDLVSLLGNAWMFYEAQQSGPITTSTPANRIPWRGDSYINDGAPDRDLSGGWYDAGDSLKLSMPFCASVWRLAWNLISYKSVQQAVRFEQQPIYTNGLRQLAHAANYLEKLHTTNNTLVAMVGDKDTDHEILDQKPLVPEQFLTANVPRPVIELNATNDGSDLVAEACAAFASLSILFNEEDPDYSNLMDKHARQLYDWMVLTAGTQYSAVDPQLEATYPSEVPHAHMMLAAAWMFRMTGEAKFEADAASFHSRAREQQINPVVGWNNPLQAAKLVLLETNPNSEETWLPGLQEWVDSQMFGDGDGVSYSRKGLWYVNDANWGVLRNSANLASIAMRTAEMVDKFATEETDAHMVVWAHHARCLARQQMNYIMGSSGRSFVTGWGENPPKRPHHRGASCAFVEQAENCTGATFNDPDRVFPNVLPGALVGGPTLFDEFEDSHLDFEQSEVSLDYNAALVSAVSGMMNLPAHFWTNTNFCPEFPIQKVDWEDIEVRPVPGVTLPDTPEDGALIL